MNKKDEAAKNTFPEVDQGCDRMTFKEGWTQGQAEMLRLAREKADKLITGAPFIKLSDLEAIAKMEAE